jgi:RND family efflux transporter MFP subunit
MIRGTIFLNAALAAVMVVSGCSRGQSMSVGPPVRAVSVATAQTMPLDSTLHAMGLLTPKDEARLSFKTGGVIESITVEEGRSVKAGQTLAVLKQAEIGATLEQARQATDKARRDLERAKALLADGVTTEEAVQDLTTAFNVALAVQSSADFNAAHSRIQASADGVVLRKLAEANEVVQAGQTVLVLGGSKRGWVVRIGLADRDVVRTHLEDSARVEFDAWPGESFAGKVSNISSAADSSTGTFTVEVQVEPGATPVAAPRMPAARTAAPRFVQGLVAKVTLSSKSNGVVQVIPLQALVEANDKEAGVFIVERDPLDPGTKTARRITIQIGRMSGTRIEVLDGLAPGAQVVTDGAAFLENGDIVRVAAQ